MSDPSPGDGPGPLSDPHTAPSIAAGLAVVGATAIIVGLATASSTVEGIAYLVAAVCIAAAFLVGVAFLALAPTPLPATALPDNPGTGLAAMDPGSLAWMDGELRHAGDVVEHRARRLERRSFGLLAFGAGALVVAQPAFWTAGSEEGLPAGAAGTVALLLAATAPVMGLMLCRTVMAGEWSAPAPRPPAPPPGAVEPAWHEHALRAMVARRLVALPVLELVEARRRRLCDIMTWLVALEVAVLVAVTIIRIGVL